MFHVVYLSFEEDGRNYIGKHTSSNPYDDYLGSFTDKEFDPTTKIILEYATTEEGALAAEIRWQKVFRVAENQVFANKAYQTSSGFKYSEPYTEERRNAHRELAKDPEWLRKTSKKGKKEKESTREKKRRVVRGSWWTSSKGELRRSVECPGGGWEKRRGGVGLWWVNNKNKTCQSESQPGPEWQQGRKWKGS